MTGKLKVLDLFSGIGGFSLGLERTGGFETVAFCEIDPFCQRVLAKHWPGVPIHDDITTLGPVGPVDVVTAGFPCQDISFAGKGAGLAGERSGLFWHVLRTLCMVGRPRVLLENVAALLDRGLGTVLGALASLGYDAQWHCIRAFRFGLPLKRDRIWIAAKPDTMRELQPDWGFPDQWGRVRYRFQAEDWALPNGGGNRARDGLSARMERLGNTVIPPVPEAHGHAILDAERTAA